MSSVHLTIENISENFDNAVDFEDKRVYSVIDGMQCYRVEVTDGTKYEAFDEDGKVVKDEELEVTLIDQVIEFEKGE